MAQWLSEGWIKDCQELGAVMPRSEGLSGVVQYVIVDGPGPDVLYYWAIRDGQLIDAELGEHANPDVELTIAFGDAKEMQRGNLDATEAFMAGKIEADGDLDTLMRLLPLTTSAEYQNLEKTLALRTDFGD